MTSCAIQLPSEQQSVKVQTAGIVKLSSGVLPSYRSDQVLVRVSHVALNPVDAKSTSLSPTPGATLGADFAGEVVAVGSKLRSRLAVCDRVFGCVFGNNPEHRENGAFAEYVVACADLLWKVPAHMSMEKASTLGVGLITIGLGLYQAMDLSLPDNPATSAGCEDETVNRHFVLVYSGGTATGMLAIQFLKMSGYSPITTCSPHNNARCLELGAAACFDYNSPTCGADIREYTKNDLYMAFDCISDSRSMKICYTAIATPSKLDTKDRMAPKAHYVALDPFPIRGHTRRSIQPTWILAFTVFDEPVNWQRPYQREAKPAHREWARQVWFPAVQELLESGLIREPKIELRDGGLRSISDGLEDILHGHAGGRKLVFAL